MLETLVAAAVTLVVGVGTTWLTIGGRERRARTTILQELDLLARLDPDGSHSGQLKDIVSRRLDWYVRVSERRERRAMHGTLLILDLVMGGLIIWFGTPGVDSLWDAAVLGVVLGVGFTGAHVVAVPIAVRLSARRDPISRRRPSRR